MATTKMTKEEMINVFKEMTLLEMNDLVKSLEEEFEVSAAPMMMAGAGAATGGDAAADAKTEFDLILKSAGEKKIQVIKIVRELTGLGLKEAKELVDGGGKVLEAMSKEKVEEAKNKLEESGAVVELA